MKASEAKIGEKYLSRTGIPVTVLGGKGGKAILKLETTGSTIRVNGDYELRPVPPQSPKDSQKGKGTPQQPTSLAAIADPLLLAGGHTVKEIAAELAKKAGNDAQGKDLEANVRARLVSYTRKGWQVIKDEKKRVKVVQRKG